MSRNAKGQFTGGGVGVGMEVRGLDEAMAALNNAKKAVHRQSAFALGLAARALLVTSQANAPVKTGALRRSGDIMPPRTSGEQAESGVIFKIGYAANVHEGRNRGRKFLQKAIATEAGEMLKLYALGLKIGDMFEKGQRKSGVKKLASAKKRGVTKNNIKTLGLGKSGGARAGAGRPRGS